MSKPLYVAGDRITIEAGYHTEGAGALRLLVTEEVPGPWRPDHLLIRGVPLGDGDAVIGLPMTVCVTSIRVMVDA